MSPLQHATVMLMKEAFVSAARTYQKSPYPCKALEWLDQDLWRLYQLGQADPVLLLCCRLNIELQKGWLAEWALAENDALPRWRARTDRFSVGD